MREIRFRVFYRGKMYPVLELHGYVHPMIAVEMELYGLGLRHVSLDSEHVEGLMQFTGLKDKNGKEIYEGDILNATDCELVGYNQSEYGESEIYEDSKGKVHYVGAGFCFDGHSAGDLPLDTFDSDALEVIGNIYENP